MIDIKEALYNILHSRYGRDVRQSIHDGIYQINENANEAIDLAQIKFGTAVNSPTDPITGFTEGSVYLNINTNIMWKLEGGLWVKKGTFKSINSISLASTSGAIDTYTITFTDGSVSNFNVTNGTDGADGKSITGITKTSTLGKVDHYDINLSDGTTISGFDVTNGADGTNGKSIANISLASTSGNVKTYDVFLDDGTKTPTGFSVEDGSSSYLHIRYSSSFDGTGMVTTPTDATVYIGILVSTSNIAPTNPSYYNWVRFIGKSGTGSGDMLAADYATKYPNTVDKAAALYDGTDEILANQLMKKSQYDADDDGIVDKADAANTATNAIDATNAKNLKKSDGTTVDADTITTKLSKVDDNSNNIKGIIGGDEWVAQSYTKGATVIYNNKIYYCKADCSASNLPSEPGSNYWEETSLGVLTEELQNIPIIDMGLEQNITLIAPTNSSPVKTSYTIPFNKAFNNVPIVTANVYGTFIPSIDVSSVVIEYITKTDFIIRIMQLDGIGTPYKVNVSWIAVERM